MQELLALLDEDQTLDRITKLHRSYTLMAMMDFLEFYAPLCLHTVLTYNKMSSSQSMERREAGFDEWQEVSWHRFN